VPFVDDDEVEDAALQALCALAVREVRVSPALVRTLNDAMPARRAAAAHVLGRVGSRDDCKHLRDRLSDLDPKVRFQAAQALLADRDKAAIPVLVALLDDAPLELAQNVEGLLGSVTGAQPTPVEMTADKASRKAARVAWSAWWQANEAKADLAGVLHDTPVARAQKARKVCTQSLDALLQLNAGAFKKSVKFPFYMQGLNPGGGNSETKNGEQIDQFFRMMSMIPQIKQELKNMAFKVTRVGRLEEYLEDAPQPEKSFLDRLRKPEIYIVYISVTRNGVPLQGDASAAMFVRLTGGRAWVVGMGNPGQRNRKKR
jgi:hypothetical protein